MTKSHDELVIRDPNSGCDLMVELPLGVVTPAQVIEYSIQENLIAGESHAGIPLAYRLLKDGYVLDPTAPLADQGIHSSDTVEVWLDDFCICLEAFL